MKYLSLIFLTIFSSISLISCLKEYTCQCTGRDNFTMKAATKAEAKRGCEAGGGQDQNGNPLCTLP